ncbi:PilZ domain-containing protein [Jiella sp. MQZ9-1]|nr:PilZ domain-containing protein [Jiella flava]
MMQDKRRSPRRKVRFRQAILATSSRDYLDGGAFVDISKSGARIRRQSSGELPKLVTVIDVSACCYRIAKVVWVGENDFGVNFSSAEFEISPAEMAALLALDRKPKADHPRKPKALEKRRWPRMRTRLRPVVLATIDQRFLADSQMVDVSAGGARLRCGDLQAIPKSIIVYDVAERCARRGEIVWKGGSDLGISFTSDAFKASPATLKRRHSAIG